MNEIEPMKKFVPMLYKTAMPSAARITSGWNQLSIVSAITVSASVTAIAIYSGACVSAIAFVSSTIAERPLTNSFSRSSSLISRMASISSSDEASGSYCTSIIVSVPSAL